MESLLRWSIENSAPASTSDGTPAPTPQPRKDLDPGIIDAILGRPDSELMKEALSAAVDERVGEEGRVAALDDLEMLVENIDNANDLERLKMWEPLHGLLSAPGSTDAVKTQTLWVIGTAVQNNPKAQEAYLALDPLPTILVFVSPSVRSSQLRSKAVYCLSGLLKHNAKAVDQLEEIGGWEILGAALENSDISVRRKTAFLFSTLLTPASTPDATLASSASASASTPTSPPQTSTATGATFHSSDSEPSAPAPIHANSHASMLRDPSSVDTAPATLKALREHGVVGRAVEGLVRVVPLLYTYVTRHGGGFEETEKKDLKEFLGRRVKKAEESGEGEVLGLTREEVGVLMRAVE
ncbi:Fes1-domain-containing protein [Stereum hirsutum FP-91666 SS1]|uniref:Fes1-domain-containing protein n=1 Tax=Stereum hirsutum (strain FP-91666) TaxID=721885 RepID=UPI0004449D5A|nr:Fes1-domain-containing protein [Stereum hirsutum FP-91666 SS1]EIM84238.1 Fes1-domain-containing protein [Stereum hirsutum FP-91666 SS1]